MNELPCIVCGGIPESVWEGEFDEYINTPHRGTIFTSHGNYGSTVFDPMDRPVDLEITICDDCLTKYHDRTYLYNKSDESYYEWELDKS